MFPLGLEHNPSAMGSCVTLDVSGGTKGYIRRGEYNAGCIELDALLNLVRIPVDTPVDRESIGSNNVGLPISILPNM